MYLLKLQNWKWLHLWFIEVCVFPDSVSLKMFHVPASELWVFETLQGSGRPPGGLLPPRQTAARSLKSSQRAEECSSGSVGPVVTVARCEDEGRQRRRGSAHLISATENLKPQCCCCWTSERRAETQTRWGFNDVRLRWDSVSRHSCAPVGNNVSDCPLWSHQGLRWFFRFGTRNLWTQADWICFPVSQKAHVHRAIP